MQAAPDGPGGGPAIDRWWDELFPGFDRDCLRSNPWEYSAAATKAGGVKQTLQGCVDGFGAVSGDARSTVVKGDVAGALTHVVEQLDGKFQLLPPVFEALESIFHGHATEMDRLYGESVAALARANTRWTERKDAEDHLEHEQSTLQTIANGLQWLKDSGAAADDIDEKQKQYDEQESTVGSARTKRDNARDAFDDCKADYHSIRDEEEGLVTAAAHALRAIDLGDLEDPGWLEAAFDWVVEGIANIGEFLYEIVENLANAVVAALDGRFLDALHYLSDALNGVLIVLAVIGLAVAVFFTGGAVLALIATAIAVVKLGIDSVLAATKHPHPVTGQPKTWTSVAVDAAFLLAGAGLGKLAGRLATGSLQSIKTELQIVKTDKGVLEALLPMAGKGPFARLSVSQVTRDLGHATRQVEYLESSIRGLTRQGYVHQGVEIFDAGLNLAGLTAPGNALKDYIDDYVLAPAR